MKKNERSPEEIAKDLENVEFAEIAEGDLMDIFGGSELSPIQTNCNCCC